MSETNEILALIDAVKNKWGYDFSNYAHASLIRRVQRCARLASRSVPALEEQILTDRESFDWFLANLTVNVTEMFRDPEFYRLLRNTVLPALRTYPNINIWHAGCSTGEEVYSLAILLHEEGLLNRARIYATDLNPENLVKAKKGIIPVAYIRDYTRSYHLSGGKEDFSKYYTAQYGNALIHKEFREKVTFLQHNLAIDSDFNEFNLILCRNVLIYFNRHLQAQVLNLLTKSLSPLGYLALGTKETLSFSPVSGLYSAVDASLKMYRKKIRSGS